ILYEIDPSFGPNILGEYYLKQDEKIPTNILKEFSEKHIEKEFMSVNVHKDNERYYSGKINGESINKDNLFLSFILREGEDILSLKSIFENIEERVIKKFSSNKQKMNEILKDGLNTIMNLIQKLQEPKIIKETMNERTKKMLDDGNIQEARELIDLGEEIPEKLAAEVKIAENLLKDKLYRKAKKSFLKAAELATFIQEDTIASFLEAKGEQVGTFPDLIKERDSLFKDLERIINELQDERLKQYEYLVNPVDRLLELSYNFEEGELLNNLTQLRKFIQRATKTAKELQALDQNIKELIKKI
ncbi:MAG: hypothetical protein JSV62_13100, partial [Promethearchaeota archaeon]